MAAATACSIVGRTRLSCLTRRFLASSSYRVCSSGLFGRTEVVSKSCFASSAASSVNPGKEATSCSNLQLDCGHDPNLSLSHHFSDQEARVLTLVWSDGTECSYPFIFLRDNCQCPACFDHDAMQRLLETMFHVDMTTICPVSVSTDANSLTVKWSDDHASVFDASWLHRRRFPTPDERVRPYGLNFSQVTWGSDLNGNIQTFNFAEMQSEPAVLLKWLEVMATQGLAVIKAKPESRQVQELTKLLGGYPRITNYGETFAVQGKPNPNNLAYTVGTLLLHVDLPFFEYQPGIQVLHCVEQDVAYGGENHLVDGFRVAELMRAEKPEMFDLLTKTGFVFYDIGKDEYGQFDLEFERPPIGLDRYGRFEYIAMNNHTRGSFINAPTEQVKRAYEALYALYEISYRKENLVMHTSAPGDMLTFNNRRVMHGRAGYNSDARRLLEGCYFDWDEMYSLMRATRRKLGLVV